MKKYLDDNVLDYLPSNEPLSNLNKERQKLSYWVHFICVIALLLAGLGVSLFSYLFWKELSLPLYNTYNVSWLLVWLMFFIGSSYYAYKGSIYGKVNLVVLGIVAVFFIVFLSINENIKNNDAVVVIKQKELILFFGVYLAGLLAFPAAYFGWKYAQALRVPEIEEEDWEWKAQTAQVGLKAWRLGALTLIILGLAWIPMLIDELGFYKKGSASEFQIEEVQETIEATVAAPEDEEMLQKNRDD